MIPKLIRENLIECPNCGWKQDITSDKCPMCDFKFKKINGSNINETKKPTKIIKKSEIPFDLKKIKILVPLQYIYNPEEFKKNNYRQFFKLIINSNELPYSVKELINHFDEIIKYANKKFINNEKRVLIKELERDLKNHRSIFSQNDLEKLKRKYKKDYYNYYEFFDVEKRIKKINYKLIEQKNNNKRNEFFNNLNRHDGIITEEDKKKLKEKYKNCFSNNFSIDYYIDRHNKKIENNTYDFEDFDDNLTDIEIEDIKEFLNLPYFYKMEHKYQLTIQANKLITQKRYYEAIDSYSNLINHELFKNDYHPYFKLTKIYHEIKDFDNELKILIEFFKSGCYCKSAKLKWFKRQLEGLKNLNYIDSAQIEKLYKIYSMYGAKNKDVYRVPVPPAVEVKREHDYRTKRSLNYSPKIFKEFVEFDENMSLKEKIRFKLKLIQKGDELLSKKSYAKAAAYYNCLLNHELFINDYHPYLKLSRCFMKTRQRLEDVKIIIQFFYSGIYCNPKSLSYFKRHLKYQSKYGCFDFSKIKILEDEYRINGAKNKSVSNVPVPIAIEITNAFKSLWDKGEDKILDDLVSLIPENSIKSFEDNNVHVEKIFDESDASIEEKSNLKLDEVPSEDIVDKSDENSIEDIEDEEVKMLLSKFKAYISTPFCLMDIREFNLSSDEIENVKKEINQDIIQKKIAGSDVDFKNIFINYCRNKTETKANFNEDDFNELVNGIDVSDYENLIVEECKIKTIDEYNSNKINKKDVPVRFKSLLNRKKREKNQLKSLDAIKKDSEVPKIKKYLNPEEQEEIYQIVETQIYSEHGLNEDVLKFTTFTMRQKIEKNKSETRKRFTSLKFNRKNFLELTNLENNQIEEFTKNIEYLIDKNLIKKDNLDEKLIQQYASIYLMRGFIWV